jgi:hypothetical protein
MIDWSVPDFPHLSLQPMVTLEERDIILEIAKCKNNVDVRGLVSELYTKTLDDNCKYLRFALASALEVWEAESLKLKSHGKDWYRIHVYGAVFDKVFISDDEYESKRSECYSRTTTVLKEYRNWEDLVLHDCVKRVRH